MGEVYVPDWAAPANVKALQTTRNGGASRMPWASFNLGDHVGDPVDAPHRVLVEARALDAEVDELEAEF